MIITKRLHRLISFFLSFSLLFQSFSPALIYAQDATQSAVTPTETVTPAPTSEVTPETTPTPGILEPAATTVEEPTVSVLSDAVLFTDKLDYSPTDTVTVSGSNLPLFQTLSITISSTDDPAISFSDFVFTDVAGSFTYAYALDGNYRPNYSVEVRDATGTVMASTTFTDDSHLSSVVVESQTPNPVVQGSSAAYNISFTKNGNGALPVTLSVTSVLPAGASASFSLNPVDITGTSTLTITTSGSTPVGTSTINIQAVGDTTKNTEATLIVSALDATPTPTPTDTPTPTASPTSAPSGNPSAELDQCGNGKVSSPDQCTGSAWQHGDLNANQAHFREGDSVPYRLTFGSLGIGSTNSVTIQWDVTKNDKHATDYLTTYNRTESVGNDPCSGVSGCGGSPSTFDIPSDPNIGSIPQIAGVFTLFNGTITAVSGYTVTGALGDQSNQITVTFTANSATPVLTWSGHIGSQIDWGAGNSASSINGSPYHMRLLDLNGSGGNQDRALSASAVPPVPTIATQVNTSGVVINNPVTDTATLTGSGQNPAAVTGNVTFFVCGPESSNPDCTNGGVQVGNATTINNGQAISSNFSPGQAGNYCFRAEYAPDASAVYSPTNHTNQTTECFVATLPPTGILHVVKDVLNPDGNAINDIHSFSVTVGSQTDSTFGEGDDATFTLDAGIYSVSEGLDGNYDIVSVSEDSDPNTTGYQVNLNPGEEKTITIINWQKKATITVTKDVVKYDLSPVSDNHTFYVTVDGTQKPFGEGNNAIFEVNPGGPYGTIELSDNNYTWVSQDGAVTIGSNGRGTINIVNKQNPGTISGYKYDATGSGIFNWTINLTGTTVLFTTTDENGFYTFTNLVTGPYSIVEKQVDGWTPIGATSYDLTINPGDTKTSNNFTNFHNISVSGQKYNDLNGNGIKETGENGLENWTINLLNTSDVLISSTPTDSSGNYSFSNLGPGTYRVREVLKPGWGQTSTNPSDIVATSGVNVAGVDFGNQMRGSIKIIKDAKPNAAQDFTFTSPQFTTFKLDDDSNATLPNNKVFSDLGSNTYTITESTVSGWTLTGLTCTGGTAVADLNNRSVAITIDQPGETVVCTFTNTKYGSIAGRKYNDLNGDGTLDTGEPYLDNWTIKLFDNQMQELNSVVTGSGSLADGQYKFTSLLPGSYYICEVPQDGWTQTDPASGQLYQGGHCRQRTLNAGQDITGAHFGNFLPGKVSGYKWNDQDGDGVWDQSEPALEYWTIYLGNDSVETDEDGYYEFTDLTAGTYALSEETDGWQQTAAPNSEVVVTSGLVLTDQNFGNFQSATIIVHKNVLGTDGNTDVSDDTSFGVKLNDGNHEIISESTSVTYDNLTPGTYTITEDNPSAGYQFVSISDDQGNTGDGIVTVASGQTYYVDITNKQVYAKLIVKKDVINDNGGTLEANDFTINVDGVNVQTNSFPGNEEGTEVLLDAGEYSVDETENLDYAKTLGENCSGEIALGDTVTCTITNDDIQAKLTVNKVVVNDDGRTKQVSDFPLFVGQTSVVSGEQNGFTAGQYTISETSDSNYASSIGGDCASDGKITLAVGDDKTCTITNDDIAAPSLTLTKSNNASGDKNPGGSVTYTLTLYVLGNNVTNASVTDLLPKGFKYRAGSWLATIDGSPLIIDEPTYHSPGTWDLGPLPKDATVIMTYIADIDESEDPGLYKDLAWAKADGNNGTVYAVGTDGNFVGTEVNVYKNLQDTPSVNVIHENKIEGAVLGASTDMLPATGASTNILLLAILGLITGVSLSGIGSYLKKKYE